MTSEKSKSRESWHCCSGDPWGSRDRQTPRLTSRRGPVFPWSCLPHSVHDLLYSQAAPKNPSSQVQSPVSRSQRPRSEHSTSSVWALLSATGYENHDRPFGQVPAPPHHHRHHYQPQQQQLHHRRHRHPPHIPRATYAPSSPRLSTPQRSRSGRSCRRCCTSHGHCRPPRRDSGRWYSSRTRSRPGSPACRTHRLSRTCPRSCRSSCKSPAVGSQQ
jgi:hypothetical protein